MQGRLMLTAVVAVTGLAITGAAFAQDAKKTLPPNPVAAGTAPQASTGGRGEELSSKQIELIQMVSTYFSQVSSIKGEFVQTSAGGTRLRGKFYIKRPGRFRFDYARPSRLVIVSDGRYVAVQDHDLKTDDRWKLDQTPFGVLLREDVNLLRDAHFVEVQDAGDTIIVAFEDKTEKAPGVLKMFFSKAPTLELKKWTTKDQQGRDTQIELTSMLRVDDFAPDLFNPVPVALERLRR